MRPPFRVFLLFAFCAAAGCARKPPPPPPAPAPAPAPVAAFSAADGTYRGTSTRFQAESRSCPSPGLVTMRVLDGVFSYRWSRDISVLARVAPDYSIRGDTGDITLAGRVSGDRIEGDVSSSSCAYHFTATKRP
jgi:hypothetical protein